MSKFKNKPVRVNILLDIELRKKYKKYCIDNEFSLSDRIRFLIEQDLNGEIK
jgi:hypothetical protein